jgi:phage gp37-like protein
MELGGGHKTSVTAGPIPFSGIKSRFLEKEACTRFGEYVEENVIVGDRLPNSKSEKPQS